MQAGDALRWFHMWDYHPPPYVQFSVFKHIVLIPYLDDVLVLFMGMYGGREEGWHVPHGMTTLHVLYVSHFKESIR